MRSQSWIGIGLGTAVCAIMTFGFTSAPAETRTLGGIPGATEGTFEVLAAGPTGGTFEAMPEGEAGGAVASTVDVLPAGGILQQLTRSTPEVDAAPQLAAYGTVDAERHVCLVFPVPRVGADCTARSPQKVGPCGVADRSQNVNEFQPGETITVQFNETVNHPSHYRISFNPDGDAFPDPTSVDDKGGGPLVLFDGIPDDEAAQQQLQITFPNVECASCTLQLIQVMYDKGGNGFGGRNAEGGNDDVYYSCADVVLRRR
jgi:hypothetical protein